MRKGVSRCRSVPVSSVENLAAIKEGELAGGTSATFSLSSPTAAWGAALWPPDRPFEKQECVFGVVGGLTKTTGGRPHPLKEVQFQRLVQRHQVTVGGDPPEGHVVLPAETEQRSDTHSQAASTHKPTLTQAEQSLRTEVRTTPCTGDQRQVTTGDQRQAGPRPQD